MADTMQWVLIAGGLALIAFGLLWDRPGFRGRAALRCRRCWFDLTGSPGVDGVSRESPVVCGECGKRHRSRRQMRRTRRHRSPIAAGLCLILLGYTAGVIPAVRARGLVAATPGFALVATMPFLSEVEGSSDALRPSTSMFSPYSVTHYSGWDVDVVREIVARAGRDGRGEGLGWLSRRLGFLLGRIEPTESITDPLSLKGLAYRSLVTSVIASDRAYGFESDWARRQVYLEFVPHTPVYLDTIAYGRIKIRYLCGEELVASVSNGDTYFLNPGVNLVTGYGGGGGGDGPMTIDIMREKDRWDRLMKRLPNGDYAFERLENDMAIGFVQVQPDGTYSMNFKASLNWGDSDLPWPDQIMVADIERTVAIEPSGVGVSPAVIDDPVLAASLGENCYARLFMKLDRQSQTFRPAFELLPGFVKDQVAERSVIFGGFVEIRAETQGDPAGRLIAQVGHGECFWLNPSEAARASNPSLRTSGILLGDTALRVRPSPNFKRDDRETNRVFVRIHSWYEAGVSEPGSFYGLHGDAFLKTPINVPMEDWTPTAVRQLIVSGLAGANDME
jgi:hypothetical protein